MHATFNLLSFDRLMQLSFGTAATVAAVAVLLATVPSTDGQTQVTCDRAMSNSCPAFARCHRHHLYCYDCSVICNLNLSIRFVSFLHDPSMKDRLFCGGGGGVTPRTDR